MLAQALERENNQSTEETRANASSLASEPVPTMAPVTESA